MISAPSATRFVDLEDGMERRKIRDEADARASLSAARRSGLTPTAWCRSAGVDGRSLRAWSINLARGAAVVGRKARSRAALTKRVELVELVAAPRAIARAAPRYTVRVGKFGIEVGDEFDAVTLRRLVAVLAAC